MARIVTSVSWTKSPFSRYLISHASLLCSSFRRRGPEEQGTAAGAGRDTESESLAPEDDSTVRPCPARNSPGPALGHKHMAFSIVAPYPQATAIAVRVTYSKGRDSIFTRGISNCRRHSLAGWARATEIIHHTPNGSFPALFLQSSLRGSSSCGWATRKLCHFQVVERNRSCAVLACTPSIQITAKFYYGAWRERRILSTGTLRYIAQASSSIDPDAAAGRDKVQLPACQRLFFLWDQSDLQVFQNSR
jgi:hypothetical protein